MSQLDNKEQNEMKIEQLQGFLDAFENQSIEDTLYQHADVLISYLKDIGEPQYIVEIIETNEVLNNFRIKILGEVQGRIDNLKNLEY